MSNTLPILNDYPARLEVNRQELLTAMGNCVSEIETMFALLVNQYQDDEHMKRIVLGYHYECLDLLSANMYFQALKMAEKSYQKFLKKEVV